MKKELEKIIYHIVEERDCVSIELVESDASNTIVLSVAGEDYGRIVGTKGRTIEMLQDLVDAYGDIPEVKGRWRLILEQPNTKSWGLRKEFVHDPDFSAEVIRKDLLNLVKLFGDVKKMSGIDTGNNLIFECVEDGNNYLNDHLKKIIGFLTLAMCKGYGKNGSIEFFK